MCCKEGDFSQWAPATVGTCPDCTRRAGDPRPGSGVSQIDFRSCGLGPDLQTQTWCKTAPCWTNAPNLSLSNAYKNCNHHGSLFSGIRPFEARLIPGYIPSVTGTKALVFICSQRWNINYSSEQLGQNKLSMDGTKKKCGNHCQHPVMKIYELQKVMSNNKNHF